ncbi:MAG TPA: putative glycoside hydrolase, partial [Clostridiales bacterium]|nr:putative glycoside hydrolase [Clostridiales bacterium]
IDFTGLEKSKKNNQITISDEDTVLDTTPIPTPEPTVTPAIEEPEETLAIIERDPVKAKGIYVTSAKANSDDFARLVNLADTTEINAMVIDVKGDTGKITYHMDSPLAKEINATTNQISDMEGLVKTLKEKDIYLIARIVAFKDPYVAEQKHEWAIKNKDGSLYRDNNDECWVNPYNHEVWDYLMEVSTKAAEIGFDEIQFDYIRFSTGKGIAEADFGEESEIKSKEDIIIEFTKYAYEKLKPLGVFVSADVYGTIISSSIDAGLVGQNYVEMAKYLDYICPMIYPSHFGEGNYGIEYPDLEPLLIVRKVLNASKEKLAQIPEDDHRAIVRPWLQDFTASWIKNYKVYGGEEVRAQIEGVYEAGYDEWILWNASTNYSVDGLLEN